MKLLALEQAMTTRQAIVESLKENHTQSTSELISFCKETFLVKSSKGTFYEALKKLQQEKIVEKTPIGYRLTSKWIEYIVNFAEKLKETHQLDFRRNNPDILEFSSMKELEHFYFDFKKKAITQMKDGKNNEILWAAPHFCSDYFSRRDNLNLSKISVDNNTTWKVVIGGNTPLDHYAKKIFTNLGFKTTIGVDYPFDFLIGIFNDVALKFEYHPRIKRAINDMFQTCKSVDQTIDTDYFTFVNQPLKNFVQIIRDKKQVDYYKFLINELEKRGAVC